MLYYDLRKFMFKVNKRIENVSSICEELFKLCLKNYRDWNFKGIQSTNNVSKSFNNSD